MLNPIEEQATGAVADPIVGDHLVDSPAGDEPQSAVHKQGPSVADESGVNIVAEELYHQQLLAEQDRVYMRTLNQLRHLYTQPLTGANKDLIARRIAGLCNIHGVDVCRRVHDNITALLDRYVPSELCPDLGQD